MGGGDFPVFECLLPPPIFGIGSLGTRCRILHQHQYAGDSGETPHIELMGYCTTLGGGEILQEKGDESEGRGEGYSFKFLSNISFKIKLMYSMIF